jgi:Tfp pilus assembly protein PilF
MFDEDFPTGPRQAAIELFRRAYQAQQAEDYAAAIELYRRSIETFPTAEAHTFLGWVYSFQERYDAAIDECLAAIRVDPAFGNPYNDIGSYLIAKGDLYNCIRWFRRALNAPRYESYASMNSAANCSMLPATTASRSKKNQTSLKPPKPCAGCRRD